MASNCFIMAHDNVFNKTVLGENAIYYSSAEEVTGLLNDISRLADAHKQTFVQKNLEIIKKHYSWEKLIDEHEKYFLWMLEDSNR